MPDRIKNMTNKRISGCIFDLLNGLKKNLCLLMTKLI